jgi:hypothetical protein
MSKNGLQDAYTQIIEETWGPMSMSRPPIKGGTTAAQEGGNRISYGPGVKIGAPEINQALASQASGQNPFEQEENISGVIEKKKVYNLIDSLTKDLDSSTIADRTALMILGKLKKLIK